MILTYPPGRHQFRPGDYPWLSAVLVILQGGAGAPDCPGGPDHPGRLTHKRIPAANLPELLNIFVGEGGRPGQPGAKPGQAGLAVLELYGRPR